MRAHNGNEHRRDESARRDAHSPPIRGQGDEHDRRASERPDAHRYAARERDAWRGRATNDGPPLDGGRGLGTRDYGYGYQPPEDARYDERDAWQRLHDHSDWEPRTHGRTSGEQGYGPEYRGRDGYGSRADRPTTARGPKGYVRTDARLQEVICERLASQDYDWSEVEVRVTNGEATLSGTVPTREMKYEAERAADSVRGVKEVLNQIRVRPGRSPA